MVVSKQGVCQEMGYQSVDRHVLMRVPANVHSYLHFDMLCMRACIYPRHACCVCAHVRMYIYSSNREGGVAAEGGSELCRGGCEGASAASSKIKVARRRGGAFDRIFSHSNNVAFDSSINYRTTICSSSSRKSACERAGLCQPAESQSTAVRLSRSTHKLFLCPVRVGVQHTENNVTGRHEAC